MRWGSVRGGGRRGRDDGRGHGRVSSDAPLDEVYVPRTTYFYHGDETVNALFTLQFLF